MTVKLLEEGAIHPIRPIKVFPFSEVEDAFRYMQKGTHIGKVVVKMPDSTETVPTISAGTSLQLDSQKTYLLVGGLGGLGRAVSTWMVECGARHFVYLSRSAQSEKHRPFIRELEAEGCSVVTIAGSATDMDDVKRAVAAARSTIGGVMQMTMVVRDTLFLEHGFDDWRAVVDPKVYGTWNLHYALQDQDQSLDFFVLLSSISGIVGTRGQAAYSAANTFLDAFVSFRHGLGLCCSCVDIGVMTGVGYLVENSHIKDILLAQDSHILREPQLIDALQLSVFANKSSFNAKTLNGFSSTPSSLVLGLRSTKPLSDLSNRSVWRHDRRMSLYHNTAAATANKSSSNDGLSAFFDSIAIDPNVLDTDSSVNFLSRLIGTQIYNFMMHPIEELDAEQTLTDLGVDSLLTIEIRNWWRRTLGLEASTLDILGAGTITGLAKLAVHGLKSKVD